MPSILLQSALGSRLGAFGFGNNVLRDKLTARLIEMGPAPDYPRLAREVLGIRNAPPELARRLVHQALVIEERHDEWRRIGREICARAPETAGVYTLLDGQDQPLYVGKAVNLRRRLRTHFSDRRWRHLKAGFTRAVTAQWQEVGSEIEALLREAALIAELEPSINVQQAAPVLATRAIPAALFRDVIVLAPSVEADEIELIAARTDGRWMIQRTRRSGADLMVHVTRLWRFFMSPLNLRLTGESKDGEPFAPIVFSWLAGRGRSATRVDPHDWPSAAALRVALHTLIRDPNLFSERLVPR